MNDHGAKVGIEHSRAEGVLETSDKDGFVNEGIEGPAQTAPFRTKGGPACRRRSRDYQYFEIGSPALRTSERRRQHIRRYPPILFVRLPIAAVPTVRAREHGPGDVAGKPCGGLRVVCFGLLLERSNQFVPRV